VSFASLPYFGVNSFKFTNAKGDSTFVRYQMKPEGDAQYLTKEQFAAAGPNYLVDEIRKRVGDGLVRMKLQVQVGEAGDKIEDPSIAWPDRLSNSAWSRSTRSILTATPPSARVIVHRERGASRHRARRP
jgi:hypothetical protein